MVVVGPHIILRAISILFSHLERARQGVPREARVFIGTIAIVVTLATWIHLPLAAMGLELATWEQFVHGTCDSFCHQDPDRSFHWAGHIFPLCARCMGMWLGITLGIGFAMVFVSRHRFWIGVIVAVLATAGSGFDFLREESGGDPLSWVRASLGFLIFFGVTLAISFDILAVLTATARFVLRLHRGEPPAGRS